MAGLNPSSSPSVSSHTSPANHENPFKVSWMNRAIIVGIIAYLFYSFSTLGLTFDRLIIGFGESERLLSRMFPPDFSRTSLLLSGLAESLQIAIISSFFGIVISLFLGLLAARNMMPSIVSTPIRGFIALCRFFSPGDYRHLVCESGGLWCASRNFDLGVCIDWLYRQVVCRSN